MKRKIIILIVTLLAMPFNVMAASIGISCPGSVTVGDNVTCTITAYHDALSGLEGTISYSGMNYNSSSNNTGSGMFNVSSSSFGGAFDISTGSKSIATYTFSTSTVGTATISVGCNALVNGDYSTISCSGASKSIFINAKPASTPTPAPSTSTKPSTNKTQSSTTTKENNKKSNDATLSNIKVSSGTLNFDANKLDYDVSVGYDVEKIEVNGVLNNDKATLKIDGDTNLKVGLNTIKLIVTAEDGTTTKEYVINITRVEKVLSNNSKLKELNINNYNLKFNKNKTNYKLNISNEDSLTINVILEDELSTYEISGNKNLKNNSVIKIKVIAEDGSTTLYKINIIKGQKQSNIVLIISLILNVILILFIIYISYKCHKNKCNIFGYNKKKFESKNFSSIDEFVE